MSVALLRHKPNQFKEKIELPTERPLHFVKIVSPKVVALYIVYIDHELTDRPHNCPFLVMHMGQQVTGINCVLFYAASIFEQAGMSDSNLSSILLGRFQHSFKMN